MRLRHTEIHRRQKRARKFHLLRAKLAAGPKEDAKQKILNKVEKMAPWLKKEDFLK